MTFKGGQMNIADNPISKPYMGSKIVLLGSCASLPGREDIDTLGWSKGMNIDSSILMIP